MNIYLVERIDKTENEISCGFMNFIAIAPDEESARHLYPNFCSNTSSIPLDETNFKNHLNNHWDNDEWPEDIEHDITTTQIGTTCDHMDGVYGSLIVCQNYIPDMV